MELIFGSSEYYKIKRQAERLRDEADIAYDDYERCRAIQNMHNFVDKLRIIYGFYDSEVNYIIDFYSLEKEYGNTVEYVNSDDDNDDSKFFWIVCILLCLLFAIASIFILKCIDNKNK